MDYQFGNKKQWRRWLWNRLAERTYDRRNALILFLAGSEALDISAAVAKGFNPSNMIAIERDGTTLAALRAKGVLAIDGDLCDVLDAWPRDRPIAIVVGDFCCGLEKSIVQRLSVCMEHESRLDTVFAFNFLRGRDKSTNGLRELIASRLSAETQKHRGNIFHFAVIVQLMKRLAPLLTDDRQSEDWWSERFDLVHELTEPSIHSYRSTAGTQVFDTIVFRSPLLRLALESGKELPRSSGPGPIPTTLKPQRRRISAVLAHHTRRLNLPSNARLSG